MLSSFRVVKHFTTVQIFRSFKSYYRSNGAVKTAFDIQVDGKRGSGRPKMTWKQLTERDRRE